MGGGGIFGGGGGGGRTETSVTTSRTDNTLSTTIIPFMRPIVISFKGERLRPWARVYPYFNGVDVSANVRPSGGVLGGALIADASGNVLGDFFVPPNTFRTGNTPFILSDDPDLSNSVSFAQTTFSSGGVSSVVQATVVTTTTIRSIPGGDPLAQTFFVDTKTSSPGCFITKLSLYFQSKDPSQSIEVELRDVVNGYPGSTVLGKVVKQSADVAVSSDSSAVTNFVFSRPIYVKNKTQYCFVVKTNSTRYNAWVATMGQNRVDKNESVSKQPNAGVMFVSANDTTWTPDQVSDVKFKVYVANFSMSAGTLVSIPVYPMYKTAYSSSIQTYAGTKTIRVFTTQSGLSVGSTTNVEVVLPAGQTTVSGIPIAELQGLKTVTEVDSVSFKFAVPTTNATVSQMVSVATVQYEPNLPVDSFAVATDATVFAGTSAKAYFKGVSGKSVSGTQTPYVVDTSWSEVMPNTVVSLPAPKLVTSFSETSARYAGQVQTKVRYDLSTTDKYVSPFIRLEGTGLVGFTNYLNNQTSGEDYVDEVSTGVGSLFSRYITSPVTLTVPSTSIKVKFAANCIQGNYIDVYYRMMSSGASGNIRDVPWTLLSPVSTFVNAPDGTKFFDYDYEKSGLPEYSTFQVKLVLRGTESSIPPRVKDLRILSLAA